MDILGNGCALIDPRKESVSWNTNATAKTAYWKVCPVRQLVSSCLTDVQIILDVCDGEIIVVELPGFVPAAQEAALPHKMQSKSAMQVGTRIALHYISHGGLILSPLPKWGLAQWLRNGYNTPVA